MWASPGDSRGLRRGRCARQRRCWLSPVPEHLPRSRATAGPGQNRGWQWHPPAAERHQGTEGHTVPEKYTPIKAARRKMGLSPLCQQERDGEDAALGSPLEPVRGSWGSRDHPCWSSWARRTRRKWLENEWTASQTLQFLSNSKEKVSGAVGWVTQQERKVPAQIPAFVSSFPPCMSLSAGMSVDNEASPVHKWLDWLLKKSVPFLT